MWRTCWLLAVALAFWANTIDAAAQGAPPDVIQLQNGGMVRGLIVENLPGDHVTIQLLSGELRTFAAAEIVSAGPAQPVTVVPATSAPTILTVAVPTVPTPAVPRVHLHVDATTDRFMLHRLVSTATLRGSRMSADAFEPICVVPCDADIAPGTIVFGLSHGTREPTRWRTPFDIRADTTLALDFIDRGTERLVGALTIVGGIAVAAAIVIPTLFASQNRFGGFSIGEPGAIFGFTVGGVVLLAGVIVGAYFAAMRDHVDLHTGAVIF